MSAWLEAAKIGGPAIITFFLGRLSTRLDRRREAKQAEAAKRPEFAIHRVDGDLYRLLNVGEMDATGVRFDLAGVEPDQVREGPDGIDLPIRDGHEFYIITAEELPAPSRLLVICDQLDAPGPVAVPL
ncbi:hypothetical protein [Amycolatopsis thermophila]|uniref:Uncharacterized protein n=1 Tax=Amycolatopsis thermophila TaxID=206084 RepID=A0ABU0ESZ3_9PSEU|nr:hypothetical protein [Amycolatopsis thermophila]MDQ0377932.1 hypothetical protein [Amycolatopsis thermophila]